MRPWFLRRRGNVLELDVDRGNALRNRDMECKYVERVAHPLERLAVGGHPNARDILDVAARAVAAGNPLGIKQNEIAGRRHGHAFTDAENATRDVGGVDRQLDCSWERNVTRRRHPGRFRISLGLAVERRDICAAAAPARHEERIKASAARRIDASPMKLKDGGTGLARKTADGVTRTRPPFVGE